MTDLGPNYYVFRINYYNYYRNIREEALLGRLRQGWGNSRMRLDNEKDFIKGWTEVWHDGHKQDFMKRKYRNLCIMKEIKPGDYIIVPRVSMDEKKSYQCDSFLVARCKSEYNFIALDGTDDFSHVIEIDKEEMFSCAYHFNADSEIIKKKFRSYQSPLNRVRKDDFKQAVSRLVELHKKDPKGFEKNNDYISIVNEATRDIRKEYLKKVRDHLSQDKDPSVFEKIITKLFEKSGYAKIDGNYYDRKGGDVDIIFEPYPEGSLMNSLHEMTGSDMPVIYVQAKKKSGIDYNAKEGVNQLIQMREHIDPPKPMPTLILINLTDEFEPSVKELAQENGVILVNGIQFADLLVRHGIDV